MFHLDNNSGVSAMPPLGAVQSSAPRWFTEGGGGVPASYPGAAWFNMIQAELLNLCAAYGISPDKANLNQLKLAIEAAVNQRAPLASPAFSGVPTAPTASQSTNNTQIATTAFVKAALTALVDSSPAALDTLNELAAALGNDPNFATTMTNALAGKQPLDNTLTALSGKDVAGILSYLGLGEGSALPVGVPVPWPSATPPTGWLKCNGAPFTASEYPKLAQAYPSLKLPDLRGEFIRGWDDGRGIDASRSIMSQQQGSLMSISVSANTNDDRITVIHVYDPPLDYDALISGVGMDSMAGYQKVFGISKLASTLSTPDLTSPLDMTIAGRTAVGGVSRPRNVAFNYIVRAA